MVHLLLLFQTLMELEFQEFYYKPDQLKLQPYYNGEKVHMLDQALTLDYYKIVMLELEDQPIQQNNKLLLTQC